MGKVIFAILLVISQFLLPAVAEFGPNMDNRASVEDYFNRWYFASMAVPARWSGSASSCYEGDISLEYRETVQTRLNLMRSLARVSPMALSDGLNTKAQGAAFITAVNRAVTHNPPPSFLCWSPERSAAAGQSELTLTFGPDAIDQFFGEAGTPSGGHVVELLHPGRQEVGIGSVPAEEGLAPATAIALGSVPRSVAASIEFVTWPPRGYVPYQLISRVWRFMYPGPGLYADFSEASVSVTRNGVPVLVRYELPPGSRFDSISFTPELPSPRDLAESIIGVTVANVVVDGGRRSYIYEVRPFVPRSTFTGPGAETGFWCDPASCKEFVAVENNGLAAVVAGLTYDRTGASSWFFGVGPLATSTAFRAFSNWCFTEFLGTGPASCAGSARLQFLALSPRTGRYFAERTGWFLTPADIERSPRSEGLMLGTSDALSQLVRIPLTSSGLDSPFLPGSPRKGFWIHAGDQNPRQGYFIEVQRDTLALAVFTYDDTGRPRWRGTVGPFASGVFQARLREFRSGFQVAGDHGPVVIQFLSETEGVLTTLGRSVAISKLRF